MINYLQFLKSKELRPIEKWVEKLGPSTGAFISESPDGEPNWWIGSISLGNNPIGLFYRKNVQAAAGSSIFIEEAVTRTAGEAIERYASLNSITVDKTIILKTIDDTLGFVRCLEEEPCYPNFKTYRLTKEIEHTSVNNLLTNEEIFIPAEHIHLGFTRRDLNAMVTAPISTGCAFFIDIQTALWNGFCEVVERDAMMRFWHTQRIPTRIDISTNNDYELKVRVSRIREKGLTLHLFEISQDIEIPTVFAIIESSIFPYYCVGASTNANIIDAINKAIDEAVSIRVMSKWNKFKKNNFSPGDFTSVNNLVSHMELYANWNSREAFNFFIDKCPVMKINTIVNSKVWITKPKKEQDFKDILLKLKEKGYDFFWKEISIPETLEFGYVVKVISPQCIPLSQSFSARWLSPFKELYKSGKINPFPHPFA